MEYQQKTKRQPAIIIDGTRIRYANLSIDWGVSFRLPSDEMLFTPKPLIYKITWVDKNEFAYAVNAQMLRCIERRSGRFMAVFTTNLDERMPTVFEIHRTVTPDEYDLFMTPINEPMEWGV